MMDCEMLKSLKTVWQVGFGDDDDFIDYFFAHYDGEDSRVVRIDGKRLVGEMHFYVFSDSDCRGAYIYGVTTLPEFRGRGVAREMIAESFRRMSRQGVAYAVLIAEEPSLRKWYATMNFVLRETVITVKGLQDAMNFAMDDEALNKGMYRVVNPLAYLRCYAAEQDVTAHEVRLKDSFIEENTGIYHISSNGAVTFEPCQDMRDAISIERLMELYPIAVTSKILL